MSQETPRITANSIDELLRPEPRYIRIEIPTTAVRALYVLLGLLVIIHLYANSLSTDSNPFGTEEFYIQYANNADLVLNGEYYRLFTSMFLHAGLMHLVFNLMALHAFGTDVESFFGSGRFLTIYILGGLAGSIASVVVTRGVSIGASGAVFAIFGAMAAFYYRNQGVYGKVARAHLSQLATLAVINLAIGFLSYSSYSSVRIDNAAHIGGAVGGFILAWFMTPVYHLERSDYEGVILRDTQPFNQVVVVPIVFLVILGVILGVS